MDLLDAEASIKNAKWYCDRREEKKAYELFFDALDGGKDCPELELTRLVAKRVSRSWQLLEDDVRAFLKAIAVRVDLYLDQLESIEIGRAHVCTPVTNAQLVCRLLLEKKKHIGRDIMTR